MNANNPEPPPKPTTGRAIWDLVVEDMVERNRTGTAKYGTPLQAHNGRDPLIDGYQEALDLAVYLRQAIEERPSTKPDDEVKRRGEWRAWLTDVVERGSAQDGGPVLDAAVSLLARCTTRGPREDG